MLAMPASTLAASTSGYTPAKAGAAKSSNRVGAHQSAPRHARPGLGVLAAFSWQQTRAAPAHSPPATAGSKPHAPSPRSHRALTTLLPCPRRALTRWVKREWQPMISFQLEWNPNELAPPDACVPRQLSWAGAHASGVRGAPDLPVAVAARRGGRRGAREGLAAKLKTRLLQEVEKHFSATPGAPRPVHGVSGGSWSWSWSGSGSWSGWGLLSPPPSPLPCARHVHSMCAVCQARPSGFPTSACTSSSPFAATPPTRGGRGRPRSPTCGSTSRPITASESPSTASARTSRARAPMPSPSVAATPSARHRYARASPSTCASRSRVAPRLSSTARATSLRC